MTMPDPWRKAIALFSIFAFSSLVLGYLWWGKFQYHHSAILFLTYAGGIAIVLLNHWVFHDTASRMGMRFDRFGSAGLLYGSITAVFCGVMAIIGSIWGHLRLDRWSDIYIYVLWAAIQQHVLQNFLRLRVEYLLANGASRAASASQKRVSFKVALVTAALFAAYHVPNHALAALAFLGAVVWCFSFTYKPSFLWVSVSQAFVAATLLAFFKYGPMNQFQVGRPGYRYEAYGDGVQVAAGYDANELPWIATVPGADKGKKALLRVFDTEGRKLAEWYAFDEFDFSGQIAVGDLGFGGGDEIAATPGPGRTNPAIVRIFDRRGKLLSQFAADTLDHGYGASVSIQCGRVYVSPGPGPAAPQRVVAFTAKGKLLREWQFTQTGFANGVKASGICPLADSVSQPFLPPVQHLLLWATVIPSNPSKVLLYDTTEDSLTAWETLSTTFGLNATLVRLGKNKIGLAVTPGYLNGYPPWVKVFELNGRQLHEFFAYQDSQSCGSNIAAVDIDGDSIDELILGEGTCPNRAAMVRIYTLDGVFIRKWNAYE